MDDDEAGWLAGHRTTRPNIRRSRRGPRRDDKTAQDIVLAPDEESTKPRHRSEAGPMQSWRVEISEPRMDTVRPFRHCSNFACCFKCVALPTAWLDMRMQEAVPRSSSECPHRLEAGLIASLRVVASRPRRSRSKIVATN